MTAVLLAGCSGGSAPSPAPDATNAPPPSSASGKTLPYAGAPKVEHPLPESVLSVHPCDGALTPEQVKTLVGKPTQGEHADNPALGTECHWSNRDTGSLATVLYTTKVSDGLSAAYANTKPQAKRWHPLSPIQGLPAVAASVYKQQATTDSFCQVTVGISDQKTIDASVSLGYSQIGKKDPCDAAAVVADMVITNLKQKAGA
ncbi:DUF3558 domain-containing protein [Amycolatopsis rubida]|uniref:DUF3558 domain-containing protein n=1 Tax=Amycolatopsis rubida TaxID=112413 RepID=UPI001FCA4E15|nr:DUF3558 domain-containing protein [Amycolatopsis rubida]